MLKRSGAITAPCGTPASILEIFEKLFLSAQRSGDRQGMIL